MRPHDRRENCSMVSLVMGECLKGSIGIARRLQITCMELRAGTSPEADEGDANDVPLILIYMMLIRVPGRYSPSPATKP